MLHAELHLPKQSINPGLDLHCIFPPWANYGLYVLNIKENIQGQLKFIDSETERNKV